MKKRKLREERKEYFLNISNTKIIIIVILLFFILILILITLNNLNFFKFNFLKTNLEKSGFGNIGPLNLPAGGKLIAYYPFDGNTNDFSGNVNNGVLNNLEIYEYTTSHLASKKNIDCSINANPENSFVIESRQCLSSSGKNCLSDICLWKRKSSVSYEYTTSHKGSGRGENIDCRVSANPGQGFVIESRQCFNIKSGNCLSDICLWKRKSSVSYEYTTSHKGSGRGENIDCRSINPGQGFVIDSRQCLSSSGANCLSDICLWKKQKDSAVFVSGKKGQAIKFSGNEYIAISNLPVSLEDGSTTTVSFWMNWPGNELTMPFGFRRYDLFFYRNSFGFNTGNGDIFGIYSRALKDKWVHVTAIFNNGDSKKSKLFINGVEQFLDLKAGIPAQAKFGSDAVISGWVDSPDYKFIGLIDELKIWNYRLSNSEVTNEYNGCIVSCSGKQCGDNGCGGSCGSCESGLECVNGNCINQFNAEISIATLKDFYSINEEIKLTDPPEEYTAGHISGNAVSDLESMRYKGYIIEFQDEPIAVKEKELKENENVKTTAAKLQATAANMGDYKTQLINRREAIKNKIKDALGKSKIVPVTANAISDSNDLEIMNEWSNIFNGILLNISSEEAEKIKSVSGVKSVIPNLEVKMSLMNSASLIGADKVWKLDSDGNNCIQSGKDCLTGKGIRVGIIDSGVDYNHQDLGGCFGINCKVVGGYDFINSNNNPMDDNGHGTHVAGIAAGNGNGGLKGIAPDAKIYAYKVLDRIGSGYMSDVISAIEKSIDPNSDGNFNDKLDIISLSLGAECKGYDYNCGPDDVISRTVDNAVDSGIVVVVAAGNRGMEMKTIGSPGTARKAITVGAYFKSNLVADFSSRGPVEWTDSNGIGQSLTKPDVVAPGVSICSASWSGKTGNCFDSKHISYSGTSMATPHVAGAIALLKQKNPGLTPEQIKQTLKDTAINLGYDANVQGSGMIDLVRAIEVESFEKPQSKIVNKINNILRGQLQISLQKNIGGTWNEVTSFEKTISIPANGILKLDNGKDNLGNQVFEGFNNLGIRASSAGNFRVYARFKSDGKFVESNWEFGVG